MSINLQSNKPFQRTSASQLKSLWRFLNKFISGIKVHVFKDFGVVYGFLFGVAATLCFLLAFIWYELFSYPFPWKVVDPSNSRFKIESFQFPDYTSTDELLHAMQILFPKGTDKEYVDKVLGDIGKAKIAFSTYKPPSEKDVIQYSYSYDQAMRSMFTKLLPIAANQFWPSHLVLITYDKQLKVEKIKVLHS